MDRLSSDIFGFLVPEVGTEAYHTFEAEHLRLWDFLQFVVFLTRRADMVERMIDELDAALHGPMPSPSPNESLPVAEEEQTRKTYTRLQDTLRTNHTPFLNQAVFKHAVDNYLTLLSEELFQIYIARPESLRSGAAVRLDFVLGFSDINGLVAAIAEKQVAELSVKGIADVARYMEENLGVSITSSDEEKLQLLVAVETRNLLVHNRGIVNEAFIRKTSDNSYKLGQHVRIGSVVNLLGLLGGLAVRIDAIVSDKFNIERKPCAAFSRLEQNRTELERNHADHFKL